MRLGINQHLVLKAFMMSESPEKTLHEVWQLYSFYLHKTIRSGKNRTCVRVSNLIKPSRIGSCEKSGHALPGFSLESAELRARRKKSREMAPQVTKETKTCRARNVRRTLLLPED